MKRGHKRSAIKKKQRRMKQNALVHQMQSATSYVHVLDFGKLGQASFSAEETKAVIDILGGVKHED
ncbi:MAG: hypothetical protein DUD32_12580 [Lactobacillus sp.]|nr:MAG: hypothetical protein DUD32_12580 [Lactobacillus sp.]